MWKSTHQPVVRLLGEHLLEAVETRLNFTFLEGHLAEHLKQRKEQRSLEMATRHESAHVDKTKQEEEEEKRSAHEQRAVVLRLDLEDHVAVLLAGGVVGRLAGERETRERLE